MHLYVTYYLNGEKQRDRISPLSYDQWRLIADGITYPADRAAYELWLNRNNLLEPSPSLLPRLLSLHKDYRFEAVSASDEPQQVLKFLRTFKGTWSALHETSFPLDGKVEVPPPSTENSALLQWSEQRKPTENCRYDNIVARCGSVGVAFRIEWKSWKKWTIRSYTYSRVTTGRSSSRVVPSLIARYMLRNGSVTERVPGVHSLLGRT